MFLRESKRTFGSTLGTLIGTKKPSTIDWSDDVDWKREERVGELPNGLNVVDVEVGEYKGEVEFIQGCTGVWNIEMLWFSISFGNGPGMS